MQYNTTPFTNITEDDFVCGWLGEEFKILAGEKKYYPSEMSQHLCKHLIEKMLNEEIKKNRHLDRKKFVQEQEQKILGEEMETKDKEVVETIKDIIERHEKQVRDYLVSMERENVSKRIEALKIADNQKEDV